MRVELPDDHWVDIRENLKGRDKTAVRSAVKVKIREGKESEQEATAAIADQMHYALLASIITGWSFEAPIPAISGGVAAVEDLDLKYLDPLVEATNDLLKQVSFKSPN